MASIWDELGAPPNPEAGSKKGPAPEQSGSIWDVPAPDAISATPQKRGLLGAANDYAIELANAAAGLPKAALDFVSPGSQASVAIERFIQEGESKQSDVVKAAKAKLSRSMESEDLMEQAKGAGQYVLQNPLLAASQAAGSFVGPGFAVKGGRVLGGALNLGEKATGRLALGSGMATSGVLAGGDAAGDAYQTVMNSPSLVDKSIEERERLATRAAHEASVVPFVLGAGSGAFGAEKALATGTKSILKTARNEFLGEFVEEGGTQLSSNVAAKQYAPETSLTKGVLGSAVLGGILGGGTGLAVGMLTKQPDSLLPGSTNISTGETNPDNNAINKAIDANSSEIATDTPLQLDAIKQQQAELDQARLDAKAQADEVAAQQAQAQAQAAEEQAKALFTQTAQAYGVKPLDVTNQFEVAGKRFFSIPQATAFLQEIDKLNEGKTPDQKALLGAALSSGAVKVPQTANPKAINNAAIKFLDSWGFGDALNKTEAAERAETLISTLEGPKALKDADQLNNFYKSITGTDSPAFVSLQQLAAEKPKLTKEAQTKQGVTNGQLQLQQQGNAGLREVSVQGGPNETGGTGTGNVRPAGVQPIGTTGIGEGSLSLQTRAVPSGGVPTSTGTNVTGPNLANADQGQAQVSSEREDALKVVNQVITRAFGERDAKIVLEVLTQEKTQAQIAKEFGISDARVNQIVGPQAQETWFARIMLAARNMGISKDEMQNFLEVMAREETVAEEQVVNEELLTEAPTEETSGLNVDDTNIATSDEDMRLGREEVSTGEEGGPSGFRVFNPEVSGATELEDASAKNRTRRKLKTTDLKNLKDFELNNLAADENTTVEELDVIVAELLRRQDVRVAKGETNAVQKQSPSKGNVRKPAGNRKEVGETNAEPQEPARARQEGQTDEEAGAQAWNEGIKDFPDAPKFEELTAEQQEDWVSFGEENWTPADVQTELIKLAKESATGKAQFSRNEGAGKDETWDADGLTSLLKQIFVANRNFDNLISVVSNYDELPAYVKNAVKKSGAIQAFVYGKRVYMLAEQIQVGQELPVFLHEVGVHIGMENLLGTVNYRKLAGQVMTWANAKGDSLETIIARAAKERVNAAVADAKENGEPLTANEQLDEMLAYFVEEAVALGVNPTAIGNETSQIAQWFRTLVAALKVSLRKIGFGKFDKLSAGNIVDLAFGAAKMEISGAYHGTAAEFRDFRTAHIGTGEGAVAFGWGLYMAERFGIAFDYMRSDVKRKQVSKKGEPNITYKGIGYKELSSLKHDLFKTDPLEYDRRNIAATMIRDLHYDYNNTLTPESLLKKKIAYFERELERAKEETATTTLLDTKYYERSVAAAKSIDPNDFITPKEKAAGNLMRVLPMAEEGALMDLDTRLAKQPEILQKIKDGFPQDVLTEIDEKSNLELEDMTGRDLQRVLVDLENQGLTDLFFQMPDSITDSIKQGRFMSEEIVSKYLNYKLGIEGVKYFDASSRNIGGQISVARLPELQKINFTALGIKFYPKYASIRSNDVVIKGSVGSQKDVLVRLSEYVPNEEVMAVIDHIKDEQARQTKNVVMFADKGVSRIATFPGAEKQGNVKFSLKKAREQANKQINKLPPSVAKPTNYVVDTIENFAKNATPYAAFTEDLADIASKYIPSVKKYVGLMKERQAIRTRLERQVDNILQAYDKLPNEVKGTGENSVNKFLMDSTRDGKWAYDPGWIKDFKADKDIDTDLQARFDALPAEAQALVKSVFAHGQSTLLAMQKSVIENINTEYDALIAAAKTAGNVQEEQDLIKKKAASLTDYRTLMRLNARKPYAPLKRFGDYVVVGKSQQYIDNEKIVNDGTSAPDVKAEAAKKLRELEKNDMHYFVQFAETVGEAKAIARTEAGNYAQVEDFEKDTSNTYGGRDVNSTFHRLRNLVEDSKDSNLSDASERAVNRLLADLHLTLLSEQSARQSERRRRGIGGAEKDMMRAFATQGRATASFISSLENTGNIYDILREMKKETDSTSSVGTRADRRKYYNEFMKRHFMGMDYRPSPFMDKALSTTSAWMLLTNPAYYLQNMTQPFMMSLPVIGGKHGYARSWKEMTRAYTDIASVIKKHGLSEHSYNKLPEDVRNVVEVLVNRGRIDISLEQDLGRWRSTEDSKLAKFGRATELLRGMAQDIETINRVATAVAAYRLEVKRSNPTAATNYADKIIYTTHGDYSGFNAPRITRQGLGRLATQFRKFQLIQISLIARLYNDAFHGEDADTRLIGKKALGYTVAHTAVMGGLMGLPGFAAIAALYGMLFGDKDEPENPELALRRAIGDDSLADLLVKGVPAALGVDVSGKIGMGQMLSILPYTDVKFTRKDLPAAGYALLTGPFGGLTLKGADAVNYIGSGDYQKGLEQLLPSGLGNLLKAERYATEGITTRAGDVVMKPEDIGAVDAFMVALGLPTKPITDRNFLNAAKFQYDEFYNEKASDIKREYVRAYKEGDNAGLNEAREEWKTLQESRAQNGYTKQPLSNLLKAPQEQKKRERNVTGGVQYNKANRGFVKKTSEL